MAHESDASAPHGGQGWLTAVDDSARISWLRPSLPADVRVRVREVRCLRAGDLNQLVVGLVGGLPPGAPRKWRQAGASTVVVTLDLVGLSNWSVSGTIDGGECVVQIVAADGRKRVVVEGESFSLCADAGWVDVNRVEAVAD